MQEMMASMDAPWLQQMAQKQMQNFEALGGIPVLSRHFVDGKPQNETTLSIIRSETLAATTVRDPGRIYQKRHDGAALRSLRIPLNGEPPVNQDIQQHILSLHERLERLDRRRGRLAHARIADRCCSMT